MSNQATRDALAARHGTNGNGNGQQAGQQRGGGRYQNRSQQAEPVHVTPYVPPLNRRKPTGVVTCPFILIEGAEKVGKSWDCAVLSSSPRVGESFWLDLSEGGADEYGAIPGARYEILVHDGSWREIMGQIRAVHAYAAEAKERGDKPVCLFIDSGSLIWLGLSRWAEIMAKRSPAGQLVLTRNADADVTVTVTHWNSAKKRWRDMILLLQTFPGIVVMTGRGKWVTAIGEDGKPIKNAPKEYKVEGESGLAYDASVWVRKERDGSSKIIGARSVHVGIRPGKDEPKHIRESDFTLETMIFDWLKYDHDRAHVRDVRNLDGDQGEAHEEHEVQKRANQARPGGTLVDPLADDPDPFTTPAPADLTDDEEQERAEFARFCDQVTAADTEQAIREAWRVGVEAKWMEQQVPAADGFTVRDVLSAAAARVKNQPRPAGAR